MTSLQLLAEALFRTPRKPFAAVAGLSLIEAAGDVGEARLVARQVRTWMTEGVKPEAIAVAGRDLNWPLLREVFDEYAVPAIWPAQEPVALCGAVRLLSRLWRLAGDDFPFREVAAVWRSTYFRPAFETDLPLKAESLLRELEVPRGRPDYVDEVEKWANEVQPAPLEDQTMETTERKERSKLAKRCLGFFQWFFALWNDLPSRGAATEWTSIVRRVAKACGIAKAPMPGPHDEAALTALGAALDEWAAGVEREFSLQEFARVYGDLARRTPWPKPAVEHGVRVLAADDAIHSSATHLILLSLQEGSFPRLAAAQDDEEPAKLATEQELFRSLVARPTEKLVFCRPGLNDKGQALLPSSFLVEVMATVKSIPVTTQTMRIDGYLKWPAISAAETRVQSAFAGNVLSPTLANAKAMADARFRKDTANKFTGLLSGKKTLTAVAARFEGKSFSPTSLETYIDCPFRYWLDQVLDVSPLEDPPEEVDARRRGSAIHRALARYHDPQKSGELGTIWEHAVGETAERTPGRVVRALWHLEHRRVHRAFQRYPSHWAGFRNKWQKHGLEPKPHAVELKFGQEGQPKLSLQIDDLELHFQGSVDRIDVCELDDGEGFWIIDYKTGSAGNYSAQSLKDFERLQLPLYAMAVEKLLPGGPRRPLGFAYWMVMKDGLKMMMPDGRRADAWADSGVEWEEYRADLIQVLRLIVGAIRSGDYRLAPRRDQVCERCDHASVCRISQTRGRLTPLPLRDTL